MQTSIIVYRLFDVAEEINLDQVQALWLSRNTIASRLRLDRISTKSITFKNPPVLVELGSHELNIGDKTYLVEVKARIQDFGVICIILNIDLDQLEEDISYEEYMELVMATDELPDEEFRDFLDSTLETIEPACTNKRVSAFDEDFVVYFFRDPIPAAWDVSHFLMKETGKLNEETTSYALSNRFSYADDVAYLAWDSAVVCDSTGCMDIPDLLEFANAQFLELRYYDNLLNKSIDRTYDVIEDASSASRTHKLQNYRKLREELLETMADVSSLTSNISNSLLVTEDIFYARVYARYMLLLKAPVWQENIEKKIKVLQRSYNLLNKEVSTHHFERMAYYIIGLMAVIVLLMLFVIFSR